MSDMEQIARSMMVDFVATVEATEKARRQDVGNIMDLITDARAARRTGMAEVRRMQEEAARIVAESLRVAEKVDDAYDAAMAKVEERHNAMRGPAVIAGRTPAAIAAE